MSRKSKISVCILLVLSISLVALSVLFHSMEASDIRLTKLKGSESEFDSMNVIHTTIFNRGSEDRNISTQFKTMGMNNPVLIKSTGNKSMKISINKDNSVDFVNKKDVYRPIENNDVDIHFKDDNLHITVYNKYNSSAREYNITPHIKNIMKVFDNGYHRSWKYFNIDGKDYFLIGYNKNGTKKINYDLLKLDKSSSRSELVYSGEFPIQDKYKGKMYLFAVKNRIFSSLVYDDNKNDVFVLNTEDYTADKFSIKDKKENISSSMGKLFTDYDEKNNVLDIYMEDSDRIVKKSYHIENGRLKYIKTMDTKMDFPSTETYFYKNKKLLKADGTNKEDLYKNSKGSSAQLSVYTEEPLYKLKRNKLFIIKRVYAGLNEFSGKNSDDYFFNSQVARKNSYIVYIYDIKSEKILYCGIISGTDIFDTNEIEIANEYK